MNQTSFVFVIENKIHHLIYYQYVYATDQQSNPSSMVDFSYMNLE